MDLIFLETPVGLSRRGAGEDTAGLWLSTDFLKYAGVEVENP